jgi:uncharacterized membrane protein
MRIFQSIRKRFVTGLLIVLPALITILLLRWLFGIVDRWITPFFIRFFIIIGLRDLLSHDLFQYFVPLVGIVITFITILGIGLLGTNLLGKRLIRDFDRLMLRIPLVKAIYGSARQLLNSFNATGKEAFREVVMLEYPRRGIYSIGFVTCPSLPELRDHVERNLINIFIPTTPNPTSGYLLMVPREDLIPLNLTIEEAIKLIVSGGIFTPAEEVRVLAEKTAME